MLILNKIKKWWSIHLLIISGLVNSCYYDSDEFLYPELDNICTTDSVSFSNNIYPVLENFCLTCHNDGSKDRIGGTISLESYENVIEVGENGRLKGAISHESGFSPMPKNSSPLKSCYMDMINLWIENGMPNN